MTRTTKKGTPDKRSWRRDRHVDELHEYLKAPHTVSEIQRQLGTCRRSVYLLIDQLNARGDLIARIGSRAAGRYVRAGAIASS